MKLSELKPGMVVEYADGTRRLVMMFDDELMLTGKTGCQLSISKWYNEDFTHKEYGANDIVKVYWGILGTFDALITPSRLLWEKPTIIELTIEQIAKKFNIKPDQIRIKK